MASKYKNKILTILFLLLAGIPTLHAEQAKKILVIGDSMTGWMGERLNAYGQANGFEVGSIIWDGSTIKKWGESSAKVKQYVDNFKPDAVIVCLGMNECAERNPEANLSRPLEALMNAIGNHPLLWVGPPSWPGKTWGEPFNTWLSGKLGNGNFFNSHNLKIPRQSATNPHPSRSGMNEWTDAIMEWIPEHASFSLPGYKKPVTSYSRGKTYIYRRMKEAL